MSDRNAAHRPKASPCAMPLLLLCLLVTSCVSTPQRMTQAALTGDTAALDELLKPGSPDIDTPIPLEIADPACPGQRMMTPLQAAACAGQEAVARKLLAARASVDLNTGAGRTPLALAIANDRDAVARLLVESGARLENVDPAGNTPLLLAVMKGNRPLADFLLKRGASPKAKNLSGETALLLSADGALSRLLVGLGADPLAVTAQGETGLHLAARSGSAETARLFLERGVDPGVRNREGATALDLARGGAGGTSAGSARERRQAEIASRVLGSPQSTGGKPGAGTGKPRPEVVAVIEQWMDGKLQQEAVAADRAAQEGRSTEALTLYAAVLAKAESIGGATEDGWRVKIVRYANSLPQLPGIPEAAREHLVRMQYLMKKGQDLELIEAEMVKALRIAPWWAEGYYNLAQIQSERGKGDAAERNFRVFIEAVPGDPRAQAAQDRIYELRVAREEEEKFRSMAGRWVDGRGNGYTLSIKGDQIHARSDAGLVFTLTHKNGLIEGSVEGGSHGGPNNCTIPAQTHPVTGKLTPDAGRISLDYLWSRYSTRYHCVNMAGVPSNCCLLCDKVCDAVTVSGSDKMSITLQPANAPRPSASSGARPAASSRDRR